MRSMRTPMSIMCNEDERLNEHLTVKTKVRGEHIGRPPEILLDGGMSTKLPMVLDVERWVERQNQTKSTNHCGV